MLKSYTIVISLVLFILVSNVESHGHMIRPLFRSNYWLDPFAPRGEENWNSGEIWCGNVPQDESYQTCGRCGDEPPRNDNEQGGRFGMLNHTTATYYEGDVIQIVSEFFFAHFGSITIDLCPYEVESDDCFQRLKILAGSEEVTDNRICVPFFGDKKYVLAKVKLPVGVTCSRCTLRWNYRISTHCEPYCTPCFNPNPTQSYRNCADVTILPHPKGSGSHVGHH